MELNENTPSVRIRALGGLEITAGWIMRSSRRIRSRTTQELLMGLIAAGGRGLSVAMACEALWPEASGAEALHALVGTTHRLRWNLRCRGAVSIQGGRVALNSARCWVDAWAFEYAVTRALAAGDEAPVADLQNALQLYRGPLFGESASLLALGARDRLRRIYSRATLTAGGRLLARGEMLGAIRLYERSVVVEDASEELYRALILAQGRIGRTHAAARTYERCWRSLQQRFGTAPSRATERARNESCMPQTGSGEGREALAASSATP